MADVAPFRLGDLVEVIATGMVGTVDEITEVGGEVRYRVGEIPTANTKQPGARIQAETLREGLFAPHELRHHV